MRTDKCDGCKGQDKTACMYIGPHDLMLLDKDGALTGHPMKAFNQEINDAEREALVEAHRSGIKSFCITIDRDARDYLPHMYGSARWTLVDDVSRLPLKAAAIYRRLTA